MGQIYYVFFLLGGGNTVSIRPNVVGVAGGNPGHVQNVQIVRGPQGQLQVSGLMQGTVGSCNLLHCFSEPLNILMHISITAR